MASINHISQRIFNHSNSGQSKPPNLAETLLKRSSRYARWMLTLSAFSSLQATAQPVKTDPSPNLVVIFADDLGWGDLGCYGNPTIRTPYLDQMAHEGMRFTQFYVAASVCTPSRAGLLTGRYPVRTGLVKGMMPGKVLFPKEKIGLPQDEVTIAEVLKQKNYATMAIGKWHLGRPAKFLPTAQGFDSYYGIPYSNDMDYVGPKDGHPGYNNVPLMRDTTVIERPAVQSTLTQRYTEQAVRFIKENAHHPFFLYLAQTMPHVPLAASEEFRGKSLRGLYGDAVSEVDWSVGQVLKALKDEGIDQNTLVIFTSDNGPWLLQKLNGGSAGPLRAGKGTTWEGGMREPMIAWWPGKIPANVTSTALATTLDILPTAAALAGVPLPKRELDGYSMLPLLEEKTDTIRKAFYYYRGTKVYAVRYNQWKAHFITQTAYPDGPQVKHNPPVLYNLETDPGERFDVADKHPDILKRMQSLLKEHVKHMGLVKKPSVEGEDLVHTANVTGGELRVQDRTSFGDAWSGGKQLWWVLARPGDKLTIPLKVNQSGNYKFYGFFSRNQDYGVIRLYVNDKPVGALVDGYAEHAEATGAISFGDVEMQAGKNKITVELIGKDSRSAGYSDGYLVGIDGFLLQKESK